MAGTIEHIHARNAALYVDTAAITFSGSVSLDQAQGSATIFKVKNMTITPPMSEIEKIDLWGSDLLDTIGSNVVGTGSWQHVAMDQKAWTLARATFTLVMSSDEAGSTTPNGDNLETIFHGSSQIDIADSPAFTRMVYGDIVTSPSLLVSNLGFVWNNGTQIMNAQMVRARIIKMGDIKITGPDGHWEMDCEAACFAQDFVREVED